MNRLYKLLPFLLLSLALLALLAGCGGEKTDPEGTTETAVTTEAATETESRERGAQVDITSVNFRELGLAPTTAESSDLYVAEATVTTSGNLAVRCYEDGTALLTVSDYWGYTAEVTATVKDGAATVKVTKPFSKEGVANVRFFGANGNNTGDDSEAFQKAIDSLPADGGEVLVPYGVYPVSKLILREGIHVRLQGKVDDVSAGYTEELAARVKGGREFAVLRNTYNGNIFYNHDPGTGTNPLPGSAGASNISVSGGVLDLDGSISAGKVQIDLNLSGPAAKPTASGNGAFVLSCGSNIVIEDVIIKDSYNGHAMQLCGVSDTTVRNCMFAGFVIRPEVAGSSTNIVLTRETIQIEYAHSGAIPPSSFEAGEFYYCKNVTITGCYFGESDKCCAPLTCIGQHGANLDANCTGLVIENNVFDDPYYCALRLPNYVDVTIQNNRFLSSTKGRTNGYFIELLILTGNSSFDGFSKTGSSATVVAACNSEKDGVRNVRICGNEFTLSGSTNKRVLSAVSSGIMPGATGVSGVFHQVAGQFYGASYTGFVRNTNFIGGLTFSGNRIAVNTSSVPSDYTVILSNVVGLECKDNTLTSAVNFSGSWNGQNGFRAGNEVADDTVNGLTVVSALQSNYILLPLANGTAKLNTDGLSHTVKLLPGSEHLHLSYSINKAGNLEVTVTCDEGYAFYGWTESGSTYQPGNTATVKANLTLTAVCR